MDGMKKVASATARRAAAVLFIAVAVLLLALSSCSDALLNEMNRLAAEANTPKISPLNNTIITAHETITLLLENAAVGATISLTGSIWLTVAPPASTLGADKTITLNLNGDVAWGAGTGKTLGVIVTSGGQTVTYTYTFNVFKGVCVRATGPNGSTGTALAPLPTIQEGIAKAVSFYGAPAEVHVAGGDYTIPSASGTGIVMTEKISVLGGYATNWSSRDWVNNHTTITDNRTLNDGAVVFNSAITTATVFEGFAVNASSGGGTTSAVRIVTAAASPTIRNNTLNAAGDASGANRYGISIESGASSPIISGNTINGGGGSLSTESIGIYVQASSSATIQDNLVYSGSVSATGDACAALSIASDTASGALVVERNSFYGGSGGDRTYVSNATVLLSFSTVPIKFRNNLVVSTPVYTGNRCGIYYSPSGTGSLEVRNNTIAFSGADSGHNSYGIYLDYSTSTVNLDNNIVLYISGTNANPSNSFCIYEGQALAPASVKNNELYGLNTSGAAIVVYHDFASGDLTVGTLNTATPPNNGSGNISTNPFIDATTYRPGTSTPAGVKGGGIDGSGASWGFTDDHDGKTRTGNGTVGWSMGCFELD